MDASGVSDSPDNINRMTGLLGRRISDLSLKIEGTSLEPLVKQLYSELEGAGISLKPRIYLSDEWGCPDGVPVIGIPFYLADSMLCEMEGKYTGIDAETTDEIMMYLRHEAGHAFNYAYRLYVRPGWQRMFGRFSRPYGEVYRTVPFSTRFVRNIPGWYAQKHPDEDFAETFAVWLNPFSNWTMKYDGTPARKKLLYVGLLVSRYGRKPPEVTEGRADRPVQNLNITLDNWYRADLALSLGDTPLPDLINADLTSLFPAKEGDSAADLLEGNLREMVRQIFAWTGIERHVLHSLMNDLIRRVKNLDLRVVPAERSRALMAATAFITTLAMNYQFKGRFIES